MKITLFLALILCILVANVRSQRRCSGFPHEPHDCQAPFDAGQGGEGCEQNANDKMWYNNNGVCEQMQYNGCGGNGNRFCTKRGCERICHIHRVG